MYEKYPTQNFGNLEKILAASAAVYMTRSKPGNLSQVLPTEQYSNIVKSYLTYL